MNLIELAVVVFILGILAAVAAPRYGDSVSRYRVDAAAQRIAAELERARQTAQTKSQTVSIAFNTAGENYTVTGVRSLDGNTATYTVNVPTNFPNTDVTAASFGGDAVLLFNGFGIPDSGGSVVIQNGAYSRTIAVAATTGATSIP
jgi:Tfp pilus assembly protein FimT